MRQSNTLIDRIISKSQSEEVVGTIGQLAGEDKSRVAVQILSWWQGESRWTRNRINISSDRRDIRVIISWRTNNIVGKGTTNQLDKESLEGALAVAQRSSEIGNPQKRVDFYTPPPKVAIPEPLIWSDNTYKDPLDERVSTISSLCTRAEEDRLLSAGYMEVRGGSMATFEPWSAWPDSVQYTMYTQAQCSTTVRHPKGDASGWAGLSSFDWASINPEKISGLALDKCLQSLNPVAIEPGRYTVILEPQAVADIVSPLMGPLSNRQGAERGDPPFGGVYEPSANVILSKLGLRIVDERITLSQDPSDPRLGIMPKPGLEKITWIKNGVLTALGHLRGYGLEKLNENNAEFPRQSYAMSGGTTSVSDMIESTKRGIVVTRIWNVSTIQQSSVLCTGVTRDGLWLVENGKISKAIRNFRITESPLFVLNQIEDMGVPIPVFNPVKNPYSPQLWPVIVPAVKARDFSFTSTVDAV